MVRPGLLCFLAAVVLLGCTKSGAGEEGGITPTDGGTADSSSGGGRDSGGESDGGDAGADGRHTPSNTYPAFPVDVAQVVDNGGPVLATPVIVTVTWSGDPQAATWAAYDDAIGGSTYWHAINGEYGVGPATGGGHVSITTPAPSSMSDQDLDVLVSTNVGNGMWPASTASTTRVRSGRSSPSTSAPSAMHPRAAHGTSPRTSTSRSSFSTRNGNAVDNGAAIVTLDKTSVVNGDIVTGTVTPTSWGSLGCVYIRFQSLISNASSSNPPPHGDYAIIVSQN